MGIHLLHTHVGGYICTCMHTHLFCVCMCIFKGFLKNSLDSEIQKKPKALSASESMNRIVGNAHEKDIENLIHKYEKEVCVFY